MKALTIRQPHASLVAAGIKTIETRSRQTHHRGPLAIHAGLHRPTEGEDVGDWWWDEDAPTGGVIVRQGGTWKQYPAPLGAIVAVAEVVDCVPMRRCWAPAVGLPPEGEHGHVVSPDEYDPDAEPPTWACGPGPDSDLIAVSDQVPYGNFTPDGWSYLLADVRPLPDPVPCRGAQGLWTVAADVEAAVLAQLREAVPS